LARSSFMELLLNLAWMLLALPAYWLWRGSRTASAGRKFTSLQCLLALGCMLVILFPVISATDDLLAMRSEMEESPAGKRSVRQASHEKGSVWKLQSPPALAATETSFLVNHAEGRHTLLTPRLLTPATPAIEGPGRAPPHSLQA
jgi:hypothetical protein